MTLLLVILAILSIAAIVWTIVELRRDGYGRRPARPRSATREWGRV